MNPRTRRILRAAVLVVALLFTAHLIANSGLDLSMLDPHASG